MKKGILSLILVLFAGIVVFYGCNDENGGTTDADARDIPGDRDVTPEPDIHLDPDVDNPDGEVKLDITPDIDADNPPDTTGCNALLGGTCSVIDFCNCPSGQACAFILNPSVPCTVIESCGGTVGTLATGTDCTSDSQCALGNACLTSSVFGSKCVHWCDDDIDCDAGHSCNMGVGYGEGVLGTDCPEYTLPYYKGCDLGCPENANCDPITGSPCAAPKTACHYEIDCDVLYCATPGTHAFGEDCSDMAGCVVGSDCISTDSGVTFLCYEFCNTSHACPTGKTCSTLNYSGDASLGICI